MLHFRPLEIQLYVIPLKTTPHPFTVPNSGWRAATKLHLHITKFTLEHEERGLLFNSQAALYLDDLTRQAGFNSIHSNLSNGLCRVSMLYHPGAVAHRKIRLIICTQSRSHTRRPIKTTGLDAMVSCAASESSS
jgi:hypothetical protein